MFSTEEFVLLTYLTTFYWDVMWNLEKSCVNITTNFCRSLNCPPIAQSGLLGCRARICSPSIHTG